MTLFDRIKKTVEQFKAQLPTHGQLRALEQKTEEPVEAEYRYAEQQLGFIPHAEMINAVIRAGRSQRLLYIRYNGKWRHIEPYELKHGAKGMLIYSWCLIDNNIHSFYLFKIQEMHLTDIPFTARFPIKV